MNTFEIKAREPSKYICWVGYDREARSFFVYVASRGRFDKRGEMLRDNHVVIWRGIEEEKIKTVDGVRELLEPYADLPAETVAGLLRASGMEAQAEKGLQSAGAK